MTKLTKLLCATALTLMSTGAIADQFQGGDQVTPHHRYDASIGGTVMGVKVTFKNRGTVYKVGERGLTKEMIVDVSGEALEAWAARELGLNVHADMTMYEDSGVDDQ